jgi:large conductance mechanosensitive channel
MGMFKEFKEFISRGNVVDLAVGVIIGGAFGSIVNSLVKDVVMPPIGLLTSGVNFADKKWALAPDQMVDGKTVPGAAIAYGSFLNTVINFIIIAVVIFIVVKAVNSFKRSEAAQPVEPPPPTTDQKLLMEIRDLLAKK